MYKKKDGMAIELIWGIQQGLLKWYDFVPGRRALYIGNVDAIVEGLQKIGLDVLCLQAAESIEVEWVRGHQRYFSYIISIANLEKELQPAKYLQIWRGLLCMDGHLLLGMNNRLGLRYFCGDRDPYIGRNFDSIENYCQAYRNPSDIFYGRMYSKAEIKQMLNTAGWEFCQFFSVLADLQNPFFLYADGYIPNEDLANRVFPTYNFPDTVFLEERGIYDSLIQNGMFHSMANAYLIDCSLLESFSNIQQVTLSMDRGPLNALLTMIRRDGIVEKRAAYPEGIEQLHRLIEHGMDLSAHGVSMVEARMNGNNYEMPYIKNEVGQVYLKRLLQKDVSAFLHAMDLFRDLILSSSEHVHDDFNDGRGIMLRRGYLDMVPLNSFFINGTFVFYDQEFCVENCPANVLLMRMVGTFYAGNLGLQKILPMEVLMKRYGLWQRRDEWARTDSNFFGDVRKERELRVYHEKKRANMDVVHSNRQRMNFSGEEYQRLFVDVFKNLQNRKLILFGSGAFARRFIALYGGDYPIAAVLDNQSGRWGMRLNGIEICSPKFLLKLDKSSFRVLICIKNYLSVTQQLRSMGISDYAIFDPNRDYQRKQNRMMVKPAAGDDTASKKYHVGYIAGVFDLFHVGHLNMFRRAKEQCDYLIVGVVSDAGVRKFKKAEPFIPFEERIEMVRSCRYVDQAEGIPLDYGGTRDAWRMYHFDVQFSGSDYVDNPDWLSEKEFLQKRGADLVFFPYTEQTSSTKIKALISQHLV